MPDAKKRYATIASHVYLLNLATGDRKHEPPMTVEVLAVVGEWAIVKSEPPKLARFDSLSVWMGYPLYDSEPWCIEVKRLTFSDDSTSSPCACECVELTFELTGGSGLPLTSG